MEFRTASNAGPLSVLNSHPMRRLETYTYFFWTLLFVSFVLQQPYANRVDPALLLMAACLAALAIPAFITLVRRERPAAEAWMFIVPLCISITVGLLNGHQLENVLRGTVPYVIYVIAIASFMRLSPESRTTMTRWYMIVATALCFKTLMILAIEGVGLGDFLTGTRASFFDINSALPFSLAALPMVFVVLRRSFWRFPIAGLLILQIVLGQSKALMGLAALSLIAIALVSRRKIQGPWQLAIARPIKTLLAVAVIGIAAITFENNPLFNRFITMVTAAETELGGRAYEMRNTLRSMEQNPLFGRGQGYVFIHRDPTSTPERPIFTERRYAHSILFYHLAIMGLIGAPFALLLLHGPVLYGAVAALRARTRGILDEHSEDVKRQEMLQTLLLYLVAGTALALYNLVTASFKNPQSLVVLGLTNGMIWTVLSEVQRLVTARQGVTDVTGRSPTSNRELD